MIWNVEDLLKPEQYIGGDNAGIDCPKCNSSDVLIEEYASSNDLIQDESKTSWKEMYQVFNMGHRLEIYTDELSAQKIIDISASFNLEAKIIGRVEDSKSNKLSISGDKGNFEY